MKIEPNTRSLNIVEKNAPITIKDNSLSGNTKKPSVTGISHRPFETTDMNEIRRKVARGLFFSTVCSIMIDKKIANSNIVK